MKATRTANGLLYTHRTIEERLTDGLVRMPNGCLEWIGCANVNGYGRIWFNGRRVKTHRLAWMLVNGPIPDGIEIRHFICDNPPCCDLAHLRPGTQADNMADMDAKGRRESHNTAKTHCPSKHEYTEANTQVDKDGGRQCKECNKIRQGMPVGCLNCGKTLQTRSLANHIARYH